VEGINAVNTILPALSRNFLLSQIFVTLKGNRSSRERVAIHLVYNIYRRSFSSRSFYL